MHLCRKLPEKKKPKPEEVGASTKIARQSEATAQEQSSRGRRTRRREVHHTSNDAQLTMEASSDGFDRNTTRNGTCRSKCRKVLPSSTPDQHTQVASPTSSPSRASLLQSTGKPANPVDANTADTNKELHNGDDTLPSPVTSNDLGLGEDLNSAMASDNEDIPMEDDDSSQRQDIDTLNPGLSRRSSRARKKVSYVPAHFDDMSDQEMEFATKDEDEDEDVSDIYNVPTSDEEEESEADIEPASADEEASSTSDAESLDLLSDEDAGPVEDDQARSNPRKKIKTGESSRTGKGIDLSLPPLASIQECMSDMTAKAVELGLCKALESLGGRPIRVATMCSGTESPLLALDEISKGQSH